MVHALINFCVKQAARKRNAFELRRFHRIELRDLGVSDRQIEAFIMGRA